MVLLRNIDLIHCVWRCVAFQFCFFFCLGRFDAFFINTQTRENILSSSSRLRWKFSHYYNYLISSNRFHVIVSIYIKRTYVWYNKRASCTHERKDAGLYSYVLVFSFCFIDYYICILYLTIETTKLTFIDSKTLIRKKGYFLLFW